MLLGAIDVGTNSIHLIVVSLDPHFGTSRTILKAREMVRLGGGDALQRGHLSKKAVARGVGAIAKFAQAARLAGAQDIRAVATSAVREASNRHEFLDAVYEASGLRVEVLDAVEEARLIHLGVSRGFSLGGKVACIFDIGGGSTEFIVGDAERPYLLRSVRLGSLRLYDEYLAEGTAQAVGMRALERHVRTTLEPVVRQLREYTFDTLIATSGTVLGLAALDAAARGLNSSRAHGYVLTLDRIAALQREMSAMTPAERRKMPGMNPRRSDIIVAGAVIVMTFLEMLGFEELVISERALREGIVVDYLERDIALARKLGDEQTKRFDAAHALARRFGQLESHENHVATLALALFDATVELHHCEPADRDVLFAAALVHDVGRAIATSSHHKHGAYIVRNAELPGWKRDEVELMAALVRYHRRSLPKPTHQEVIDAGPDQREKIEKLAGILRVADALDRRRLGLVSSLTAQVANATVAVRLEVLQDVAPEIEAASFKGDLFERAFGRQLTFETVARDIYSTSFGESEPDASELATRRFAG